MHLSALASGGLLMVCIADDWLTAMTQYNKWYCGNDSQTDVNCLATERMNNTYHHNSLYGSSWTLPMQEDPDSFFAAGYHSAADARHVTRISIWSLFLRSCTPVLSIWRNINLFSPRNEMLIGLATSSIAYLLVGMKDAGCRRITYEESDLFAFLWCPTYYQPIQETVCTAMTCEREPYDSWSQWINFDNDTIDWLGAG